MLTRAVSKQTLRPLCYYSTNDVTGESYCIKVNGAEFLLD